MKMQNLIPSASLVCALALSGVESVQAQQTTAAGTASKALAALEQAHADGKYTFLMFYKQSDDATKAMASALTQGLADKEEKAVIVYARVGDAAEQTLVAKYAVERAPMPMTLAVAPNGAITAIYPQRVPAESLDGAFVTPTMMLTMKNLQENKLVLVTVQGSTNAPAPVAINDFESDPHFKDRIVTIAMTAADPLEGRFVGQMQIDPQAKVTHTVLLAPPGVMVGKFNAAASKDEIAAALAKAGKCCDDPNCKHHQPAPTPRTAPRTAPAARR